MIQKLFLATLLAVASSCATVPEPVPPPPAAVAEVRKPVTLLISIDGFRPDYLGRGLAPRLDALAESGVRAILRPSFPTLTFPNHYSIVTGLRPDRHGIIDNSMEDPRRPGVKFALWDARQTLDPFWWDGGEPIWVTAQKQGVRTGTMFWPGSEVLIGGQRPASWQRYDKNISNAQRVETIIDWLRRPAATRPQLLTLYFDTVDVAAHEHGPEATATVAAIREVDARIGDLLGELEALGQPANLVIVSDHGMSATSPERIVRIDRMLDPSAFRAVSELALLTLQPQPGREEEVARALLKPHDHMQCWRKSEIPARFEYGRHARVPAFVCLAEPGWMIYSAEPKWRVPLGMHGYDNQLADMAATFIGHGPAFRNGVTLDAFDNVDLYPLLARLAGVTAITGEGDEDALAALR
jgi:predicted AlkP superfamily pyrophosphatase or phosphodiesterase